MGKREGQARKRWLGLGKPIQPGRAGAGGPGLQLQHGHPRGRAGLAAGRASKGLPHGLRKRKNSRKWEAGAHRLFPSLLLSELKRGKSRPTFPIPVPARELPPPPPLACSPVMRGDQLGRVPEVLFEAQLKGLANGADDVLSKPFGTLQDVAGWGHSRGCQGTRGEGGGHAQTGPSPSFSAAGAPAELPGPAHLSL